MAKPNGINFIYEPAVLDYMKQKGTDTIVVEMVTSENSDFEVSELYFHLCAEKEADRFINKKRYRVVETQHGRVLLPPMKLDCQDTVTFRLRKVLFVKMLKCDGIEIGK